VFNSLSHIKVEKVLLQLNARGRSNGTGSLFAFVIDHQSFVTVSGSAEKDIAPSIPLPRKDRLVHLRTGGSSKRRGPAVQT
jgi:hypothetical protein